MSEPELQSERFGRLYAASSAINRAVARSRSREELENEVVRVLVEIGGFAMAFLAWNDPATNQLVPSARFGDKGGYAEHIHMFSDDRPEGQGPAGTAFRSGTPYVCDNFLDDPRTLPWREAAKMNGWRASAGFPVSIGGLTSGILSVYSLEPGEFAADLVELLEQVALDLAFGIEHLEGEAQRRQAQEDLAASELRLQLVLDAAVLGTWDWDLRSGKVIWGGHSERMFGLQPGEFRGTYDDFVWCVHPDDLRGLILVSEEACDAHRPYSHEFRVVWRDGSEHWVHGRGGFQYSDTGEPIRMYGAVMEITERRRAEAAMRESEARLQQAVRVADIGIFDHNHVANTIYLSPRDREINGLGPDEQITLDTYISRVHPEDRERIAAAVQSSLDPSGDGSFDVENRLLLPDGTVRWTSTRAQTFFEGRGAARRPVRTVGAVRDVTEKKRAGDEQKKLATVVEMNRDFIGIATMDGRGVYVNPAGMELIGFSGSDASLLTLFDCFAEGDGRRDANRIYAALLEQGHWSGESQFRNLKTGELIDVDINAFQVRDENGAPLYMATVTRDIRERRRSELEKARLEEQLFQARKMESIGRLAGGVAHDFNNLLTVINGYSYLLLTKLGDNDPMRGPVADIRSAGESASALVRQLLAFSRKQVLEPRVLDVNRAMEGMQPMLERLLGESMELRVVLGANCGSVHADPHQLEQVIMNLVVNARDAMPGGGRLLIETSSVDLDRPQATPRRYAVLSVSDRGIGMDQETRRRIFEPFFTTKPVGQGTGLGLATVQGIVEQSGGHVSVFSEQGQGTTFKIYLPALGPGPSSDEPSTLPALGGSETILVVEDRIGVRHYTEAALRSYGYKVLQAANAIEALAIAQRERGPIHLMLTDVVMPNIGGGELAQQLEKLRPGIRVIFMSGFSGNVPQVRDALAAPAKFIQKPFSPEELAEKVREVLGPSTAVL
jgi:two-component system cell cycle sensor histidine kinase/response regulator CckA